MSALAATLAVAGTFAVVALALQIARQWLPRGASDDLVDRIDRLLPQTQCAQCGHPGCRPYAEAVAAGGPIDRCPPGGAATVAALAKLLDRALTPAAPDEAPSFARIRTDDCIGCTQCLAACPVDAIVGAAGFRHVVLIADCTGCGLCLPPCPVDCIDLEPVAHLVASARVG